VLQYTSRRGELIIVDLAHIPAGHQELILGDARPEYHAGLIRAFAAGAVREHRWLAMATRAQREIGWGSYVWLRYEPPASEPFALACTIYGHIPHLEGVVAAEEGAAVNLAAAGVEPMPVEMTVAALRESYRFGWRYGHWYSEVEPGGEPGENHIAWLTQMSRAEFERARRLGWPEVPPGR
jgi:hypothetical protein